MSKDTQTADPKLYAERDIIEQGEFYARHVNHMTSERLFAKSDIAAELAHRDIEIAKWRALYQDMLDDSTAVRKEVARLEEIIRLRGSHADVCDFYGECRCELKEFE